MNFYDATSSILWEALRMVADLEAFPDQDRYAKPCPVCRLIGCERHGQEPKR